MKISILTATYNREKYLKKLYESIKINIQAKTGLECEWIVVDDGSSDGTKNIIENFIIEKKVSIKYYYQENSGKMAAINKAVESAEGDLIIDCDSDDYFPDNAFKIIQSYSKTLLDNPELYAIAFLKKNENGKISGKKFININKPTTMFDLYFKEDIEGEKILLYNSNIRKKYKHELEENENFITEARMYHKMDDKYKIICVNEAIEIGSYMQDGYTKNINKIFKKSPKGYYYYFKEILQKDMKGVLMQKRIYAIKHYILFGYLSKKKFDAKSIRGSFNRLIYTLLYIPGIIKSRNF